MNEKREKRMKALGTSRPRLEWKGDVLSKIGFRSAMRGTHLSKGERGLHVEGQICQKRRENGGTLHGEKSNSIGNTQH